MFSQRGVLNLIHNVHDLQEATRRVNANRLNAVDGELLSTEEVKAFCPILNTSPNTRYPIMGGTLQRRGGNARHDAVAWGFARAADARGVDIIQNCEGHRHRCRGRPGDRGADHPGRDRRAQGGHRCRRPQLGVGQDGGLPPADREPPPAGAGLGAAQAGAALRHHVEWRARLRQPVRQGRARNRRRSRPAQLLQPARRPAHDRGSDGGAGGADPDFQPGAHDALLGRHRGCLPRRLARHRQDARGWALHQRRLGHRRLQGDAGLRLGVWPTLSRPASRTRSTRPSPSTASPRAR